MRISMIRAEIKKKLNDGLNAVKFQNFSKDLTLPNLSCFFFLKISARIIDMRLFTCNR